MAHELDITNNVASFASARVPAWHRLGTVFDRAMTVDEAQAAAHLAGWKVRKLAMTSTEITDDGVDSIEVQDYRHVVRTNPINGRTEHLGVVGAKYQHVQNEEHAAFLEALLDMSGARFIETAGALRGGRQVFYCAKLPDAMLIGGVDRHDLYVTAMNGHDGSMALSAIASPVRVVCANTQAAAISRAAQRWSTRHTAGAARAIQDARKALDMTFTFNKAFEAEAERMLNETMTEDAFARVCAEIWPLERNASTTTQSNHRRRMIDMRALFGADTQANIAGTRWAGYNAVTEYVDHFAPVRITNAGAAASRAARAIGSDASAVKARAFELLSVGA